MLSLSSPSCLLKGVLSNHSQTLGGDGVAVDKIVVVEDGAEDTFGQQVMLVHHLLTESLRLGSSQVRQIAAKFVNAVKNRLFC